MKPLRLNPAVVGLFLFVVICSGCQHKKPVLVMPQQQPATAAPQPMPTPAPDDTQTAEQPPEAQPAATPAEQPQSAEKPKPKHGRRAATSKPPTSTGDKTGSEPAKNGSAKTKQSLDNSDVPPPVHISPGPTPADAAHTQTSTDQLLQGAEANLNGITRQLSKDEEAMRVQSRDFIKQSHNALAENDLARAHTLAVKARLLSDELIKQR